MPCPPIEVKGGKALAPTWPQRGDGACGRRVLPRPRGNAIHDRLQPVKRDRLGYYRINDMRE